MTPDDAAQYLEFIGYEDSPYIEVVEDPEAQAGPMGKFAHCYKVDVYGNGTPADENNPLTLGDFGQIYISGIPYGTYLVTEIKADGDRYVKESMYFTISEDEQVISTDIHNTTKENVVKIVKVDSETGKTVPSANTAFRIRYMGSPEYDDPTQTPNYGKYLPNATNINASVTDPNDYIFFTDEAGEVTIPYALPYGDYQVEEILVPDGYYIGSYDEDGVADSSDGTSDSYGPDGDNPVHNEAEDGTLDTEIAQNYPVLMAHKRSFDDAAIKYLGLEGKVYSDQQIAASLEDAADEPAPSQNEPTRSGTGRTFGTTNAQKLVNDTMVAIASGTNEIKVLEKTVHSLNTSVCPISQSLVCTTDKTSVKEELTAALEMKRDAVDILHDKLEGYQQTVHDAKEAVDACVAQEKAYQAKLDLMKLLSSLKTVKVTIPKKPDPKTLEALEHRNEELRKEQADAMQYEIIKSHAKRAESLKTELEVAETLVKELAPSGGIRKQVLAHSIGPMEDVCNECMKTLLPKYRLRFNPDDNFNISVQDVSLPGVTFSFDALSRGEQLSVLFILMLMLNQVNQVRIICMDNLNDLDVEALKRFLKVVEDVDPSYYDHIFLSSIDHEGFIEAFDKCKIDHAIFECHAKTISKWTAPGAGY